jgi:hypothetical protein
MLWTHQLRCTSNFALACEVLMTFLKQMIYDPHFSCPSADNLSLALPDNKPSQFVVGRLLGSYPETGFWEISSGKPRSSAQSR